MDTAPATSPPPRIALVEDDECLALLLRYNLEVIGFAVDWIARGDEAIQEFLERPPALVVLDWMLPGIAGIEVLRQLRRNPRTRHVPVLMLTGCASAEERKWAIACGVDVFLAKPFAVGDFLDNLERLHPEASIKARLAETEHAICAEWRMQKTGRTYLERNRLAVTVVGGDEPERPQIDDATDRLPAVLSAVLLVLAGLLVAGVLVSTARSTEIKPRSNSAVACVTLEAVRAHGFLDEVGYRRVVRFLTIEGNPYRGEFPESYRAFMEACASLRASHEPQALADRANGTGNE